jgi:hypothetical protein
MIAGPRGIHESWFVILDEHGQLSRPMRAPADGIVRTADLDRDGVDELVAVNTGGTHQGFTAWGAMLVRFHGQRIELITLGEVESEGCGTWFSEEFATAAVIFVAIDHRTYRFREERYVVSCYPWRDDFEPIPTEAFVRITEAPRVFPATDCRGQPTCASVDTNDAPP